MWKSSASILLLIVFAATAHAASSAKTASTPNAVVVPLKLRSAIGTNLGPIVYWDSELRFVDVMKSSSEWISGDKSQWDNKQPLDLDTNGWVRSLTPGQISHTLMLRGNADRYPAGQYLVRYKGQGTLKFEYAARIVSQKPGEIVLNVTPGPTGIHMTIETTNPADYLRDITITMPGGICSGDPFKQVASAQQCTSGRFLSYADNSGSIIFYPPFLQSLRAYSVVRFMDWMQTNNSKVSRWSQHTPFLYETWAKSTGAPVEVMIELANRLGAHPWFTLPHQSDDDYARNFAALVKAKLNPALRVYVEDSNEVWNWQFAQTDYNRKQAAAQTPPIDAMQYHALRTRNLGQIFKEALGPTRVVAVLAAQAASLGTAQRGLDHLKGRFGIANLGIDAVAIAPYVALSPNPAQASTFTAMTVDALFAHIRTNVLAPTISGMKKYADMTKTFNLPLISYEGGQHLVGIKGAENNDQLTALFTAFNRDPRMKQLYLDYLAGWKQAGGQLFVHYHHVGLFSKWGSWGSLEYLEQQRGAAPKFDAIQTFIEQNPVWWPQ